MLRLFKTHYLKSRVINITYHIDKVMAEYAKQGFEDIDEKFIEDDAMKYHECNFLSHIVTRWEADRSRFSNAEWDKYQEGLQKLERYREMQDLMTNLNDFYWEMKGLYLETQKELATPNAWSRREYTTRTFETETHDAIKKYNKLIKDLNDYPEWQGKVRDDIGFYVHLLYNSFNHQKGFEELFKDFDPQYFFK